MIPPSEKLISIAKNYGWKDENIIKINLPRWDKYNILNNKLNFNNIETINNNSIFLMFTWRDLKPNKKISSYYIKNIEKILINEILNKELEKQNITLYFTFHRNLNMNYYNIYKNFLKSHKLLKLIKQNEISECLYKSNLIITDFSSIIFDFIYRRKPYILYIPDAEDPNIEDIYTIDYYNTILKFKKGILKFDNNYLDIYKVINKILYYINNQFNIEPKLEDFYNSFGLKIDNNTNKFINYLLNIA